MYKRIRGLKSVPVKYENQLINEGVITKVEAETLRSDYFEKLERQLEESYTFKPTVFPL